MKQIKRSELIKSKGDYIGLVMGPDFKLDVLDTDPINEMELLQTGKTENYPDFIRSNLFDLDTDLIKNRERREVFYEKDEAIQLFNKGENINITPYETCRDGMFDEDKNIKILVLEYHEIKEYYELFSRLYNQDIYKEHRLEEKIQKDLEEKQLTKKEGNWKI